MLRKVGESAWPISEKDAVVSIKDILSNSVHTRAGI